VTRRLALIVSADLGLIGLVLILKYGWALAQLFA
jgi:hypothetical protein